MRLKSVLIFGIVLFFALSVTGQPEDPSSATESSPAVATEPPSQPLGATPVNSAPEETPVPKVVVEKPQHNFGTVAEGETVVQEFKILNKGTAPLNIEKVKTG